MNGNIPPLDATSTTDEPLIPIAVALGLVATLHVQNPLGRDGQRKNQPMQNRPKLDLQWSPGEHFRSFTIKWREKHGSPSRGFSKCSVAAYPR